MSLIALSIFFCYGFADRLGQLLGETGTAVFTRLASFLLVCIGVQIAWNGFGALLSLVQFHSR
jgi:multiple antibiotic resistance protein